MAKTYSNPNVNPNVIGTGEVIDGSLTAADLAANSVTSSELADNAVDTAAIADDAVTSAKIAGDAVGSSEIAADAVGTSEIAANAVTASELADNAVDTAAIADDAVTAAKIAADAVGTSEIAANAVTASELADNAVDTAAIADSAVTSAKLAASAGCGSGTDAAKPAAASVPAGFLYLSTDVAGGTLYRSTGAAWVQAGSSVSAAGVADGGITTAKLADGAVTDVKLSFDAPQAFVASGSISATGSRDVTFAGSAAQTLTLPAATAGRRFTIRNIDTADSVSLARAGSDTINNALTTIAIEPGTVVDVYADASGHWTANERPVTVAAGMYLANSGSPTHSSNGNWQKVGSGGGTSTWTSIRDIRPNGVGAQVDTATNKRIDIRLAGIYKISGGVCFTSLGDGVLNGLSIAESGTRKRTVQEKNGGTAIDINKRLSYEVALAAGAYIEIYAYQNESTSEAYLTTEATFNEILVTRVGPAW